MRSQCLTFELTHPVYKTNKCSGYIVSGECEDFACNCMKEHECNSSILEYFDCPPGLKCCQSEFYDNQASY